MRILYLTAGAAGMVCGSCLRDNALALALRDLGEDVTLVPLYTPTRTDEPNASADRVFFGGISVYLEEKLALFRRTPWLVDRLWDSPRVIRWATRRAGATDPARLGPLTVSVLEGEGGHQAKEIAKLLDWIGRQAPFDVVNLPNSLLSGLAAPLRRALGVPVVCTLQGEDLFIEGLVEPYRSRALALVRENAASVDRFVAVSEYCASSMSALVGIAAEKIAVVPLGIRVDGFEPAARAREDGAPFVVGYLARVAPEKGLHNLVDAYALFRRRVGRPARLEVAGYLAPEHRGYLAAAFDRLRAAGLDGEMRYHGAPDRAGKIRFLQGLDALSVPSGYREPKGLYLLEAMACGVPVVQPRHGAFVEIVEDTGGGLLVDSEAAEDVAAGLAALAEDREAARAMGARGREAVLARYRAERMAERTLDVYRDLVGTARSAEAARRAPA